MLTKLGKYQIRRELGRGAMGVVFEGFDPFIERTVAIKTIQKSLIDQSEVQEILNRFRREAQAAGRLTHPNIVAIYEYGEENEVAFIAMELLDGVELKDYFDKAKRFQLSESVNIMSQLLEALDYSHGRGVVHRDIKPSNILITGDGKIKIADFGIAKIESSDLTQVGTVLGTPSYMSPEQFAGLAADRRSDIYSAGVILYQLLTGERPFTGSNMNVIMHKVMQQAHVPPSTLNPEVSKAMDEVVGKVLAKRPEDRFQTAAEFMAALKLAANLPRHGSSASEATMKITPPSPKQSNADHGSALSFNLADFDKRLEETRQAASRIVQEPVRDEELEEYEPMTIVSAAPAPVTPKQAPPQAPAESGLLAMLAREAKEKLDTRQSDEQDKHARDLRVHNALERIHKFFVPFVQHVNHVEPTISRTYRFDARTAYTNLKWRRGAVDYRKLSLSDTSLLAYVTFAVKLFSPEPVLIKRPWDQFAAVKKELQHLRLNTVDDLDYIYRNQRQEWLQAQLDPELTVQVQFQGNYEKSKIDVTARNLEDFGAVAIVLEPEQITTALLDELGLFLIGGTNKLPALLRRV